MRKDTSSHSLKNKVLLFKNFLANSGECEQHFSFSCGTHYLASALRRAGISVLFSDFKIALNGQSSAIQRANLDRILKENPDINFIAINLSEFFFEKTEKLIVYLRERSRAFIGVGGHMPTLTPKHVFAHLPLINFVVRGTGEAILPRVIRILSGKNISSPLAEKEKAGLARLKGFLFSNENTLIATDLEFVNRPKNYDDSTLDFSFFQKDDLIPGMPLFTSWGCFNNCPFCTSSSKRIYIPKSFRNLKRILEDYHRRLREIFGVNIPSSALRLSFYDDDFLGDPQRAIRFFEYIKTTSFKIAFFQSGINSFFQSIAGKPTRTLSKRLLRSLTPEIFSAQNDDNVYIGLENLSDQELRRLGKGYASKKAMKAIEALAQKKIKVVYGFIVSNQLTTVGDILENLFRFSALQVRYGSYVKALTPVVTHLISLYPTSSYRNVQLNKRKQFLKVRRILTNKSYPELNYPLVSYDIPLSRVVRLVVSRVGYLFQIENSYLKLFDEILAYLVYLQQKNPLEKNAINRAINLYQDYPQKIFNQTGSKVINDRNNLLLMVTRRCRLSSNDHPVVRKDQDMDEDNLFRAIDLLLTSSKSRIHLGFTGGEPLLRFDLVKKGVDYAKRAAKRKNRTISFSLATSPFALTSKMADFLGQENFLLELSFDGEDWFHSFCKVDKAPRIRPYRSIRSELGKIFTRGINNCVVIEARPATVMHLSRNFYYLVKLGIKDIVINYAIGFFWNKDALKEIIRQMDLIKSVFYPYVRRGDIRLSNLGPKVEPAVLNGEVMLDVDGAFHLSTDWSFEGVAGKKIPPFGRLGDYKNLNDIFLSRYLIMQRLFECYSQARVRRVICNNIELGEQIKEYFSQWKKVKVTDKYYSLKTLSPKDAMRCFF